MWGQAVADTEPYTPSGIIPMRVGTRNTIQKSLFNSQDRPHACGDKSMTVADIVP